MPLDVASLIARRAMEVDSSGIRKVFDLAAKLKDPINLSIGQPDFDVPEAIKERAIEAIRMGRNRYTPTQGIPELIAGIKPKVADEMEALARSEPSEEGRKKGSAKGSWEDPSVLILSGTSAGLVLLMMATLNPGDEVLFLDPYFVMYKHLPKLCGAVPVPVDSYPDFRLHGERLEAAITPRTKMLILCSPNNPTGIALTHQELAEAAEIARKHKLLVVSDEIYDAFVYGSEEIRRGHASIAPLLPEQTIILKGYSKTYGMTGWRLGYAAAGGPGGGATRAVIEQMTKLQQYTFVCAPSMVQYAALEAVGPGGGEEAAEIAGYVKAYEQKRNRVVERLSDVFELNEPGGAFYAFPKVPGGKTGTEFVQKAIERNVLVIPGNVFSGRDTHFRLSYATSDGKLEAGLTILRELGQEMGRLNR